MQQNFFTTLTYSYVEPIQIRYGINDYVNQTHEDNTNISYIMIHILMC